jgi:hypothetical protein
MRIKCYHCGSDDIAYVRHLTGTGGWSEYSCMICGKDVISKNCDVVCEEGCQGRYLDRDLPIWICVRFRNVICGLDEGKEKQFYTVTK